MTTVVFVESENFTKYLSNYFPTDTQYHDFQKYLMEQPSVGDVMRGCNGLRKVRWASSRRGKGKRGGLRIIYLHVPEAKRIYILDIYEKDEADDLNLTQRKSLAALAEVYRLEAIRNDERNRARRTPPAL